MGHGKAPVLNPAWFYWQICPELGRQRQFVNFIEPLAVRKKHFSLSLQAINIFRKSSTQRRKEINYKINEYQRISKNKNIFGWSSAGVSIISTGVFGIFTFLSSESYNNYQSATITADAVAFKDEFQTYDTISYIALGAGLVSAGVSAYFFMSKPSVENLSIEYVSLGIEMARLEGEL